MLAAVCGYLPPKIFLTVELNILSVGVFSGKTFLIEGGPPSPTSLKSLTGAGLAKMVRKILSALGLAVKILITQGLWPRFDYYP